MVAAALALLARQLRYSHDQVAFTTFFALGELGYALVAHVTLAYPTGIVRDRAERWFLGRAYTVAIAFPLAILAFYDGTERLRYFDPLPRNSALLVQGDASLAPSCSLRRSPLCAPCSTGWSRSRRRLPSSCSTTCSGGRPSA
jgi:hypothetical protein